MTGGQLLSELDIGEARPIPSLGTWLVKTCKIIGIGGAGCNFVLTGDAKIVRLAYRASKC